MFILQNIIADIVRQSFINSKRGKVILYFIIATDSAAISREPYIALTVLHNETDGIGTKRIFLTCLVGVVLIDP